MSDWVLKYADARGEIHQQTASAGTEQEVRDRYSQQGFLIYSIRPRRSGIAARTGLLGRSKKLNLERFLIFNQQFVTLIRAGLPILKALDLLADRLTDPNLGNHVKAVRDDVKNGTLLSEAFRRQGVFPKIYTTSVLAGEKSGGLVEVLERYVSYQKLSLAVRKKVMVSLLYPLLLVGAAAALIVFLVVFVVPNFAELYKSMSADLPTITQVLIAVGTTARSYVLLGAAALIGAGVLFRFWSRRESGKQTLDNLKMKLPLFGDMWIKSTTPSVKAGKVTFNVKNAGATMHGLSIVPAPAKVSGGSVVESSTVAHGATLAGGQSETLSANLKPGRYELVCHMPGHYAAGQHIPFTVR